MRELVQDYITALDAVREVVSGLSNVIWASETQSDLVRYTNSRQDSLPPDTENREHCQTSVFHLLELFLSIFFFSILESERIESTLAKAKVTSRKV